MRITGSLLLFTQLASAQQYCVGGPTSTADTNVGFVRLIGDNIVEYTPPCPGILGLDLQLEPMLYIYQGVSYPPSTVAWSTCGGPYSSVGAIWIDFNQNSIFESGETVMTFTGTTQQNRTFTINMPPGSGDGPTRMRVMLWEGGTQPLDPCRSITWGSMIDFGVVLVNTPAPTPAPTASISIADSFVDGPGVGNTPLNRAAVFTVYAMLNDNTHASTGGVSWLMNLYGSNTRTVAPVAWTDYRDGTYGGRYTLTVNDTYVLYISSGTEQIKNSPLTIQVLPGEEPEQIGALVSELD